jgi:hypothetical protein
LRGNMRRLQRRKKKYEGMREAYMHTNLWRECLYSGFFQPYWYYSWYW